MHWMHEQFCSCSVQVCSIPFYSCNLPGVWWQHGQEYRASHYLNHPFTARYVCINPVTWHHAIVLRAGLTGFPHTGDCGPGFVQVSPLSQCGKHCTVLGYLFMIHYYHIMYLLTSSLGRFVSIYP
jgi:hypothetical protein